MSPLDEAACRARANRCDSLYCLSSEGELMIRVRTYWVPGFFYEANPESSTRNTEANNFTSNLVRPRYVQVIVAPAYGPADAL